MSFQFEIILPIRPHLKKMIARTKKVDPFKIVMGKCHYSTIIYNSLHRHVVRVRKTTQNYAEQMHIIIPSDLSRENRFTFDSRTLNQIDKTLASIFEDKFVLFLDDNCEDKGDIQRYIQKFKDNYSLSEDDIQTDTLKKIYYRARKKSGSEDSSNFRTINKQKKKQKKTEHSTNIIEQQKLF